MYVTAHADRETLDRARITEPFGYIVKPFHSVDFRAQIEMALWKHRTEQKLRASEAWLSTTFRNVADALIATDTDGNIAFMNQPASELTGWDVAESRGKPLLDVFQAYDEATDRPVVHPLEAIYDGREVGTGPRTFKLLKRGGSDWAFVEARLSANRDEESLLGIIAVFRDVTERRKAEKQSLQLQKMNSLSRMALGLAGELMESRRNTEVLLKQLMAESSGPALRRLKEVSRLSTCQQAVVQQLIALGRTGAGQPALVDLNEILTGQEATFRKALGLRRSLKMTLQPGIPLIQTDPEDLRENLFRLVVEAQHAMPDEGAVEISTMTSRSDTVQSVRLSIRDNGKGVRADAKERIFDPYFQSRPGNKNPGFSLAMVYQFVASSGGSIEVESASGKGVAYLLSFPAADHPVCLP